MPGGLYPPPSIWNEWQENGNPNHPTEQRGWELIAVTCVLYMLACCVLAVRLSMRLKHHNAGLDDLFILAAFLPTTGLALAACLAVRLYGFDRHVWDLSPELIVTSRKLTMIVIIFYVWSTGLTKVSILLFYRRLASGTVSRCFQNLTKGVMFSVIAYIFIATFLPFVGCRPFNAWWNSPNPAWALQHQRGIEWNCFDEGASDVAISLISVVQDFLACGLPSVLFWKLQLPLRQKLALSAIFGIGSFLCVTGVLRIYYTYLIFYKTYDVTWVAYHAWLWTVIEAHLAIICASPPALKLIFRCLLRTDCGRGSVRMHNPSRVQHPNQRFPASDGGAEVNITKVTEHSGSIDNTTTTTTTTLINSSTSSSFRRISPAFREDIEFGWIRVDRETKVSITVRPRPELSRYQSCFPDLSDEIADVESPIPRRCTRTPTQLIDRRTSVDPSVPWELVEAIMPGVGAADSEEVDRSESKCTLYDRLLCN